MLKARLPFAALILTLPVLSQGSLLRLDGLAKGDYFGRSVASAGDVDADGVDDIVIGADGDDRTDRDAGSIRIVSGKTGKIIWTVLGNSIGDFFGYAVDGAGDVNADGYADVVVGAYGDDPQNQLDAGSAYVVSGKTGQIIHTFHGTAVEDRLGFSVAGAGDFDADGYDDVIAGGWSHRLPGAPTAGFARIHSGKTGAILLNIDGLATSEYFGFSVGGAGDVDLDGYDDVVVGAPGVSSSFKNGGVARVYAGNANQTKKLLYTFKGQSAFSFFGMTVGTLGDVDGDYHSDIMVSSLFDSRNGANLGSLDVYSGKTGTLLYTVYGENPFNFFGYSAAGGSDVNADGVNDFIVGAPLASGVAPVSGAAYVYSGKDGVLLSKLTGAKTADGFGLSVGCCGDVSILNGAQNGGQEVLVGAVFEDQNQLLESGSVHVIDLGFSAQLALAEIYGVACPSSSGDRPRIGYRGRAAIGTSYDTTLRGASPGVSGFLNLGAPTDLPLGTYGFAGCTLYATTNGFNFPVVVSATGHSQKSISLPNNPSGIGLHFVGQWIIADPGANAGGYTFSDALKMTVGN